MAEPTILPISKSGTFKGSMRLLASLDHAHLSDGTCIKDREGTCDAPRRKPPLENPFPGQVLRQVFNWGDSSQDGPIEEKRPEVAKIEDADIVTSEIAFRDGTRHKIVLDIDMPVKVVDSSTPGHHHLFIDKELSWAEYKSLLHLLAELGVIEYGYVGASLERGFTGVRLPWKKKDDIDLPRCARCHKTPGEIHEYVVFSKEEGITPADFVRQNEGTYNDSNGRFWCTECYIALGQPLGVAP